MPTSSSSADASATFNPLIAELLPLERLNRVNRRRWRERASSLFRGQTMARSARLLPDYHAPTHLIEGRDESGAVEFLHRAGVVVRDVGRVDRVADRTAGHGA